MLSDELHCLLVLNSEIVTDIHITLDDDDGWPAIELEISPKTRGRRQ